MAWSKYILTNFTVNFDIGNRLWLCNDDYFIYSIKAISDAFMFNWTLHILCRYANTCCAGHCAAVLSFVTLQMPPFSISAKFFGFAVKLMVALWWYYRKLFQCAYNLDSNDRTINANIMSADAGLEAAAKGSQSFCNTFLKVCMAAYM